MYIKINRKIFFNSIFKHYLKNQEKQEIKRFNLSFDIKKQEFHMTVDNKNGSFKLAVDYQLSVTGLSSFIKRGYYIFQKREGHTYIFTYAGQHRHFVLKGGENYNGN